MHTTNYNGTWKYFCCLACIGYKGFWRAVLRILYDGKNFVWRRIYAESTALTKLVVGYSNGYSDFFKLLIELAKIIQIIELLTTFGPPKYIS